MLRIVIIEDEKLTAMDLSDTLKSIDSEIDIITILPSVKKSIDFFKKRSDYDLIFSDIQLSDGISFNIFKSIDIKKPVIFCTAYDQYALNAFKTYAIDYILKPFNKDSIRKAIEKYQTLMTRVLKEDNRYTKTIQSLGEQISNQHQSIIVFKGDKIIPIETHKIALFYVEDKYVHIVTFDLNKHLISQTLEELEILCGTQFFRANRQYLVNRKAIKSAHKHYNRKIVLDLAIEFPTHIYIGKLRNAGFIDWLSAH